MTFNISIRHRVVLNFQNYLLCNSHLDFIPFLRDLRRSWKVVLICPALVNYVVIKRQLRRLLRVVSFSLKTAILVFTIQNIFVLFMTSFALHLCILCKGRTFQWNFYSKETNNISNVIKMSVRTRLPFRLSS